MTAKPTPSAPVLSLAEVVEVNAKYLALLESAVIAMSEDGWLMHGVEGMSEAQETALIAYDAIRAKDAKS